MDFLKSCWTNLQAVEGFTHVEYLIYSHQDATDGDKGLWDSPEQAYELLLCLRQRNVLVQSAVQQKKVCVFGGFQAADEHMKELGWQVHQRGRLETVALTRANNDPKAVMHNQHVFTMFLAAVEASLSISLSASCGAVRVGHMTWLIPTEGDHQLLSLRVQTTSQGTLALLPHASNTGLSTAAERDGANIILAPSGTPATIASSLSSLALNDNDNAPPYQARREARMRLSRRAKDDSWKDKATRRLRPSSLPHDDPWLRVSLPSSTSLERIECLWPGPLCLEVPLRDSAPSMHQTDSMRWFDSNNPYQDPLSTAESWFLGQEERAELEQKTRQAEKDKVTTANIPPDEAISDHLSVTSPVYSRSIQDQTIGNGIYPTPPDAVPPIVCPDPSIPSVVVSDKPIDALPGLAEDNPDQDQDQDMRRNSNSSDVDLDTEHYRKGSTDDLFNDVDEEMFGNPDVTDADFSFFDNPGGLRAMPTLSGPSEDMVDALPEPTPNSDPVVHHPPLMEPELEEDIPDKVVEAQDFQEQNIKAEDVPEEIVSTPPLSPLKIKERLLPSDQEEANPVKLRRDSTFLPVVFKGDIINFDAKYRTLGKFDSKITKKTENTNRSNSIALPEKISKARNFKPLFRRRATVAVTNFTPRDDASQQESDLETSQESDSDSDSISSVQGSLRSLDIRKRKRVSADEGPSPRPLAESVVESDVESVVSDATAMADPGPIIDQLVAARESQNRVIEQQQKFSDNLSMWRAPLKSLQTNQDLNIWPVLDFTADDLVDIAQLVSEQSSFSASSSLEKSTSPTVGSPVYSTAQDALRQVFEKAQDCDFAKVGAMAAHHAEQAIAAAAKSHQRPIPRRPGTVNSVITLPAPAVHVRRAGQGWELQPTAVNFWEALGLEPAYGPKDVVAFALYPDSGIVCEAVADFMHNVRLTYESRKFGFHHVGGETIEHEDGLMPYKSHGEASVVNILQGIQTACNALGDLLHDAELGAPTIIYMVDPFQDESMIKYLCGCFQAMLIAYSSDREDPPPLILQIIPMSRVACPTALIVPDQPWLASLASFIYDRVPAMEKDDHDSAWHINSSPCIHLATPPSRKINFALGEKTPRNLLEEAQILHVAYAVNADNSWLSAAWIDNSGRRHHHASYCLSNADGRTILTELRDTTLSLARTSNWRIFVARAGVMRDWEKRIWRERPSDTWSIALLDVETLPSLQVGANANDWNAQNAFMTPAATPQASAFTSPEGGSVVTPTTAGETPQQVESAQQQPPDPDAILIDNTDETWGVLMPFSCTRSTTLSRPLASGLLLKRGSTSTTNLPSLAVDLMDVMPPRPVQDGHTQPSWLTQRAPETVLKECLVWYRGLGLLGRIRGIPGCEDGQVPWHLGVAITGADALRGFLG